MAKTGHHSVGPARSGKQGPPYGLFVPKPSSQVGSQCPRFQGNPEQVIALMSTDPNRTWTGQELATRLQIKLHNLLTQLAEWSRLGFLAHTDYGTYALTTRPGNTSWTNPPDP